MLKVLENPLYYLDNFHHVIEWISKRYQDILNKDETNFLQQFLALPQASRALFVRMVMRKGQFFRESKLTYSEIGPSSDAVSFLCDLGWVTLNPHIDIDRLFTLLTKSEINTTFQLSSVEKKLLKSDQLEMLRISYTEAKPFSEWGSVCTDAVYQILNKPLCDRLRLIFFGNLRQDWSEFILSDLGIYVYEKIDLPSSSRGFQSRQDIDDYLALHLCKERFYNRVPIDDVLQELDLCLPTNLWLIRRKDKLLFEIGQHLEKQKNWEHAFRIYITTAYPGVRLRTIRVLEKNNQAQLAAQWLEKAMQAPESEAEYQQLCRIAPRLNRKLQLPPLAPVNKTPIPEIHLRLPAPDSSFFVEGTVRDYLHQDDTPVFYVENGLINSLFGLLCWPAIFAAIPGAFFHPFHQGPVDLLSTDFHVRRLTEFDACFCELDSDQYRQTMCQRFKEKRGIQCPFVFWHMLNDELLCLALDCIPAIHLKKLFQRILFDIKTNRSGLPDLIQFWPKERRYNMIEVKGPGDRLQDNQKRWIEYCLRHMIPISVCYLAWDEELV